MQVTLKMDLDNMVARVGINRRVAVKFIPALIGLVLVWLWILLFVAVIGLNTTTFHSLFGWTAVFPHL